MVQTKDQYILVHKAVKELFQEQLRMIDAHPYENVDLNGMPVNREEHLYERVAINKSLGKIKAIFSEQQVNLLKCFSRPQRHSKQTNKLPESIHSD